MIPIVLASGSSYRAELLKKLQLEFVSFSSNIDEAPQIGESVADLVMRLSQAKAQAVSAVYSSHLIIGSDQAAVCNGEFLSKPGNRQEAIHQLKAQSGQIIHFYTGLCLLNSVTGQALKDMDISAVHFKRLTDRQIENYVDCEQPFDCAGSFKSEGLGIALFSRIDAPDPNALIGLPLIKLINLLAKFGVEVI